MIAIPNADMRALTLALILIAGPAWAQPSCMPQTFSVGQKVVVVDVRQNEAGAAPDLKIGEIFTIKTVRSSDTRVPPAVQLNEREARHSGTGYFHGWRFCPLEMY